MEGFDGQSRSIEVLMDFSQLLRFYHGAIA